MSTSRPIRASKQRAIDNIKKLVAEMNTYDDNGVLYEEDAILHTGTSVEPGKVTLQNAKDAYVYSPHFVKIYALYPPKFRDNLMEDDVRIDYMIEVLSNIVAGRPLVNTSNKTYQYVIDYYRNYTKEAAEYVLDMIENMDEECFAGID
jgi:hypothetical protein